MKRSRKSRTGKPSRSPGLRPGSGNGAAHRDVAAMIYRMWALRRRIGRRGQELAAIGQASAPSKGKAQLTKLKRELANAVGELDFCKRKQEWLQAALNSQRHARQ